MKLSKEIRITNTKRALIVASRFGSSYLVIWTAFVLQNGGLAASTTLPRSTLLGTAGNEQLGPDLIDGPLADRRDSGVWQG